MSLPSWFWAGVPVELRPAGYGQRPKRKGRPLPRRECSTCGRLVSIMSGRRRSELRAHRCVPRLLERAP